MNPYLILIILFVTLPITVPVIVVGWFFAFAKSKELKDRGVKLGSIVTIPLNTFLAVGYGMDVLFNATWGSVIFREFPKEWTFSQRVRRQYKAGNHVATTWRERINKILPGHV